MSTVEAGVLQGDKVSAIQKRHMVESDTSERKQHSRLSLIDLKNSHFLGRTPYLHFDQTLYHTYYLLLVSQPHPLR